MDISKYYTNDTVKKVIKDPITGLDGDASIEFYGHDSIMFRKVQHEASHKLKSDMDSGVDIKTPEYKIKSECEMLAKLTVSWEGIECNGEAMDISSAKEVYLKSRWLYEQIEADIYKRSIFFVSAQTA